MKRCQFIAVLLGFMAFVAFANDALAFYHASMGRFLSRDPGPVRVGSGGMAAGGHFVQRDQYADGMNLYQYVGGNPATRVDPTGLFHSGQHDSIARAGASRSGLKFSWGLATGSYLDFMVKADVDTDTYHFFDPTYHAQGVGFVNVIKTRMDLIKTTKCWRNWAWTRNDQNILTDMGTALHVLQDIYAHTDWVDGTNMDVVYAAYGDPRRGTNPPNAGTVNLANIENGNAAEFATTILYDGGTNPFADDAHNRYAADTPTYGRASGPFDKKGKRIGLGPAAYTNAANAATATSKEFIIWAKNNMTKCCCEIVFGNGQCAGNKN